MVSDSHARRLPSYWGTLSCFTDIHLEHGGRPEDLYQRLVGFAEDNLRSSNIRHHGEQLTEDEELTPTLENFIVLT